MIHDEPHELAGETATLKEDASHPRVKDFGGSEIQIEDYWDRVFGASWNHAPANPAAMIYRGRVMKQDLPGDDEVLYGKIDGLGHLVHASELQEADWEQEETTGNPFVG